MTEAPSPTRALAAHTERLRYEMLPRELVHLVKQCVLDTFGVSVAASTLAPEAKIVADCVEELSGKRIASVWGFSRKAPAP